ncbi:MAG TPA: aldo/keto reductase, partial [bacterium]|nr:aldo/keto reductase [bacterium]
VVDRRAAVARRCGGTLPQLALAWALARPPVTVALSGARTPAEIADAAGAAGVRLSEQVLHEIETIMQDAAGLSAVLPT